MTLLKFSKIHELKKKLELIIQDSRSITETTVKIVCSC